MHPCPYFYFFLLVSVVIYDAKQCCFQSMDDCNLHQACKINVIFVGVFFKIYLVFGVETSNMYSLVKGCCRACEFAVDQRTN